MWHTTMNSYALSSQTTEIVNCSHPLGYCTFQSATVVVEYVPAGVVQIYQLLCVYVELEQMMLTFLTFTISENLIENYDIFGQKNVSCFLRCRFGVYCLKVALQYLAASSMRECCTGFCDVHTYTYRM